MNMNVRDNPLIIWKRIEDHVGRFVGQGPHIDRENIVGDVFLWFLVHPDYVPSGRVIQWRIMDCLRISNRIREVEGYDGDYGCGDDGSTIEQNEILDGLVDRALLSNRERMILYHVYVKGLSMVDIGSLFNVGSARIVRELCEIKKKLLEAVMVENLNEEL